MIKAIFAVDESDAFGIKGGLPWNDADDLAHFKKITTGNVVVMGSSTYKSLQSSLPDRISVVVSRKSFEKFPNLVSGGMIGVLDDLQSKYNDKDIFVIGGKSVLLQSRSMIEELYITYIKGVHVADTYLDVKSFLGLNLLTANIKFDLKSIKNFETNSKAVYERVWK